MTQQPRGQDGAVIQADRDAAADLTALLKGFNQSLLELAIRDGFEDQSDVVQAFRKHRLAHTPAPQIGEAERLRIAWWNDMRERGVSQDTAIAKIRAALHPAQGE